MPAQAPTEAAVWRWRSTTSAGCRFTGRPWASRRSGPPSLTPHRGDDVEPRRGEGAGLAQAEEPGACLPGDGQCSAGQPLRTGGPRHSKGGFPFLEDGSQRETHRPGLLQCEGNSPLHPHTVSHNGGEGQASRGFPRTSHVLPRRKEPCLSQLAHLSCMTLSVDSEGMPGSRREAGDGKLTAAPRTAANQPPAGKRQVNEVNARPWVLPEHWAGQNLSGQRPEADCRPEDLSSAAEAGYLMGFLSGWELRGHYRPSNLEATACGKGADTAL